MAPRMDLVTFEWGGPGELEATAAAAACDSSIGVEAWRVRLLAIMDEALAAVLGEIPSEAVEWAGYVTGQYERARDALRVTELTLRASMERASLDTDSGVHDVAVSTTIEVSAVAVIEAHTCPCDGVEQKATERRRLLETASRLLAKIERAEERAHRVRQRLIEESAGPDSSTPQEPAAGELDELVAQIASWNEQRVAKAQDERQLWSESPPRLAPCRREHVHVGAWTKRVASLAPLTARLRVRDERVVERLRRDALERARAERATHRRRWAARGAVVVAAVAALGALVLIRHQQASARELDRVAQLLSRHDRIQIKDIKVPSSLFVGAGVVKQLPARLRAELFDVQGPGVDRGHRDVLVAELRHWLESSDAQMAMLSEVMATTGGSDLQNLVQLPTRAENSLRPPPGYLVVGLTPRFRQVLSDYYGWVEVVMLDATTGEPLPVTAPWILVERRRYCHGDGALIELRFIIKIVDDGFVYGLESAGPSLDLVCE